MAHKPHIPHTIRRGLVYYFNARIQDGILRKSLETNRYDEALSMVSEIVKRSEESGGIRFMSKKDLKSIVEKTKQKIIKVATAVIEPDSSERDEALKLYSEYSNSTIEKHIMYSQVPLEYISNGHIGLPSFTIE